jgi:1,4-alpha-glucan branching enzyme
LADGVAFVTPDARYEAVHEQDGIWVAAFVAEAVPDYRVEVTYGAVSTVVDDPYRFLPTVGELDLHLIATGRHERLWDALGARVKTFGSVMGEVTGTSFAVWAPNAQAVRVVGDFNSWTSGATAMRSLGASGVWEVFVPGVGVGARYKYELHTRDGSWLQKADPMARATETPPATASVVTAAVHEWGDRDWLERRAATNAHLGPMSIYEVHIGSWREGLGYRELADELPAYVADLGFTHVEFLPVAEHPFGGSWGYQVTSYYAPTARYGTPDDFRYLVDRLHQAGIGVILDWVPAHFPKDAFALARFDGTALYEYPDPQRGEHPDWGTLVFNYGRTEVRNFLMSNATYWMEEFHADGLRVDAVASMLYLDYSRGPGQWSPNAYGGRENLEAINMLQEVNATAYKRTPGIVMAAEESTSWPGVTAPTNVGGLGFGLKWNMGWMNDTLRYLAEDPVNRRYHHGEVTFSMVYAFSEHFVLPLSHDEVVHGKGSLYSKMPGDNWQKLAGVRALLAYQWSHPGKQLLFMGSEFAQEQEWHSEGSLDWWLLDRADHLGVLTLVRDLNALYKSHPALWAEDFDSAGFQWIDANDSGRNILSYVRRAPDGQQVTVVINFAGTPHEGYRLALPEGGDWLELLNTDAESYGGSGVGNLGRVRAEEIPWSGLDHSAQVRIPPLGAVFFAPAGP